MPQPSAPCSAFPGSAEWPLRCISTASGQQVPCSQVSAGQVSNGMYSRYRLGPNGEMCVGPGTLVVADGLSVDFVHGTIEDIYTTLKDDWAWYAMVAVGAIAGIAGMWLLTREFFRK